MSEIKIAVVYHKDAFIVRNDVFFPIRVGEFANTDADVLSDNSGDNIAEKNSSYNELTAIYWLWKHFDEIGNPDYIGLNHYRRFFNFRKSKYAYYEDNEINDTIFEKINYSKSFLEDVLSQYDFVAPTPNKRKSVYNNYKLAHRIEDLDLIVNVIEEVSPEYSSATKLYLNGKQAYFYNMFIFHKADFFGYCDWTFKILELYEKRCAYKEERMFVSECLTGIYFTYLMQQDKVPAHFPVLFIAEKKPPFKKAVEVCKQNLHNKNMSKIYSLKPLLTFFVPKSVLIRRKRKSALKKNNF